MSCMLKKNDFRIFFKYILIGGCLFLIDLSTFLFATNYLKIDPVWSQFSSRATGAMIGFIAHKNITFKKKRLKQHFNMAKQSTGYMLVAFFTFFISPFILLQFLSWMHGHKVYAKIFTEVILVTITFFSMKYIFKPVKE